jgi:hypothetical protein
MNWKNVRLLMQVERKSGRLIKINKATNYKENKFLAHWGYWLAIGLGVIAGLLIGASLYFVPIGAAVFAKMETGDLSILLHCQQ